MNLLPPGNHSAFNGAPELIGHYIPPHVTFQLIQQLGTVKPSMLFFWLTLSIMSKMQQQVVFEQFVVNEFFELVLMTKCRDKLSELHDNLIVLRICCKVFAIVLCQLHCSLDVGLNRLFLNLLKTSICENVGRQTQYFRHNFSV